VKITCRCGSTTMDFPNLKEDAFPDGWETDCCFIDRNQSAIIKSDEPPRSSVEQWLNSTWLLNRTRSGVWVPSMACYNHYTGWMKRKGLTPIVTVNRFGRLMRGLCSSCRRNSGKHYLLEKYPS
jgi:hypothetical protein